MTKRILITGVSQGLGRAMAENFIAEGCTVVGCARNETAIQDLNQTYGKPHSFTAVDVSDEAQVEQWKDQLLANYDPPDLVVNNAALINQSTEFWNVPTAEFDQIIDVNIKGVANVMRQFLPAMMAKKQGIIVNFSSGWGRSTSPHVAPYCTTKWAIEGLTRAIAQELPSGMAAIPLNPGIIHTEMLETCFGSSAASFTPVNAWVKKAVPFLLNIQPKQNGQPLTVPA
ncbi:short-chain dehydrogenase/reductase SDR [Halothece sp. PCC 7418]|uniref:SDR family oxidoreductase n=1 Tax=Halothece sp. (strain PCC 7418) TaxID=65093 RepID=UPI0002A07F94|nr:SDR family oxidoreductase [Halothece sp. PCC 7418]AFZ45917.1 short-chain dehydrogenase/reductase SDR [Halothece sp. PCC 7418]